MSEHLFPDSDGSLVNIFATSFIGFKLVIDGAIPLLKLWFKFLLVFAPFILMTATSFPLVCLLHSGGCCVGVESVRMDGRG